MPFGPQQMMMQRKGPTMGPSPNPGGVPSAGLPSMSGAETPGNMLLTAIAQQVNEAKKSNANFASRNLQQMKRVVGVHMTQLQQAHPEVARHLNRAWAA